MSTDDALGADELERIFVELVAPDIFAATLTTERPLDESELLYFPLPHT